MSEQQVQTGQEGQQTAAPWYGEIADADLKGYAENKGWKAPVDAITSYRSLERLIGAEKAGRAVVMPGDSATPEEQAAFFNKLGRPEAPDKYDLDLPAEHDADLVKWFRENAHKHGLTAKQAKGFLADYQAMTGGRIDALKTEAGLKLTAETDALKREWGSAHEGKIAAAKTAVQAFGVKAEEIDALEQVMGFGGVMKFFDRIASKMGQSGFISAETRSGGFEALTPAAAEARIQALKADKGHTERLMKRDANTMAEWDRLHQQAYGKAA